MGVDMDGKGPGWKAVEQDREAVPERRLVGVGSTRQAPEKTALPVSLGGGRPPGSMVRSKVERVNEPAPVADECPETARFLLRVSEGLEMIVDKRLVDT